MNDISEQLSALLDRDRIRERIASLARGEDRRDPDLIRAAYWPDSTTDFGIFKGSFDAYLDWVVPGSPAIVLTQHFLGQTVVELRGAMALAETLVSSYHRVNLGSEERDFTIGGRYLDRFEKREGQWRIAQRTMLYDWVQNGGVSADWSQGLMGTPLSGAHYTGRTQDDHSQSFFKRG